MWNCEEPRETQQAAGVVSLVSLNRPVTVAGTAAFDPSLLMPERNILCAVKADRLVKHKNG